MLYATTKEAAAEAQIASAKKHIQLAKSLNKLQSNRDFKAVIEKGFFEEEAARLARVFDSPELPQEARDEIKNALAGIGALDRYLRGIQMKSEIAQNSLEQWEDELDTLRHEDEDAESAL
jgi:hypothetical protein